MKKFAPFILLTVFLGLNACSSKEVAQTDTVPSSSYVAEKQNELSDLQGKLDAKRDMTHSTKMGNPQSFDRRAINDQYAEIGRIRMELDELKADPSAVSRMEKQRRIEERIAWLRNQASYRAE